LPGPKNGSFPYRPRPAARRGRITIDGIGATSAGAMNAVVLAYEWAIGKQGGAGRSFAAFWQE
jgi:predicted acylesterase/phospholipase RssA